MTLKTILIATVVALLLAMAWKFKDSEAVRSLLDKAQERVKKIEFDNGTVRSSAPASAPSSSGTTKGKAISGVRKCKRGEQIIYTDDVCPPGSIDLAIVNGSVNMLPAAIARDDVPINSGEPKNSTPKDMNSNVPPQTLRDKMVERAINQ